MRADVREEQFREEAAPSRPAVQRTVDLALQALDREGVRWAVLREPDLEDPAGDVDILCHQADLPRLEAALAPIGFGRLRTHGRGSHSFFLAYDGADERWIKLDVVTELAFGRYQEFRLDSAEGCLERSRRTGLFVVLSTDDAFWTLLLHSLLDPGTLSPAQRMALRELGSAASMDGPLALALEGVLSKPGHAAVLLEVTQTGDWTALEGLAQGVRNAWVRGSPVRVRARAKWNVLLRRASRLPPLCRGGPVILARPEESSLAAAVAGRWYLPHRLLRLGDSRRDTIAGVLAARWLAARGRLVVLVGPPNSSLPRFLAHVSRVREFRSVSDMASSRPLPDSVARLWRLYMGREA
jgi:hypothetical protein